MSGLTPVTIVDKNGRTTTVHKKADGSTTNDFRVAGATLKPSTPPKLGWIPSTKNALGATPEGSGYAFYFSNDANMDYYGGGTEQYIGFESKNIKDIKNEIDAKLKEVSESYRKGMSNSENRNLNLMQDHLTALQVQLNGNDDLKALIRRDKANENIWNIADTGEHLDHYWEITPHIIDKIHRYGKAIENTQPDLSTEERNLELAKVLEENEPAVISVSPDDTIDTYTEDIGTIYDKIKSELSAAGAF